MDYSTAWDEAIDEYNSYGIASLAVRHRIDKGTSSLMYGFKALGISGIHGKNTMFQPITAVCA